MSILPQDIIASLALQAPSSNHSMSGSLSDQLLQALECDKVHLQSGGANIYASAHSFFSDYSNLEAMQEAVLRYGQPNCQTDWMLMFQVYNAAVYFKKFPLPSSDSANCTLIQSLIAGVKTEQVNVQQAFTTAGVGDQNWLRYHQQPLTDRLADLNALQANLNCTSAIQQQTAAADIGILSSLTAPGGTAGAPAGTDWVTYGIYGVAGLVLITAIILIFKKK